ncbi:MAG: hypothetical protein LWY06_14360 [Firmicutes bacterium]|nr:hypothetical protein [Bacillota bacterium]
MKNRIVKSKGLLIICLAIVALLGALQFSFLAVIENARTRILLERRRETAKSLADMGAQYYSMEGRQFSPGNPGATYPRMKMKTEKTGVGKGVSSYSFYSPALIRTGNFILRYDYTSGRPVKITSVGSFEGVTFEKPLNP